MSAVYNWSMPWTHYLFTAVFVVLLAFIIASTPDHTEAPVAPLPLTVIEHTEQATTSPTFSPEADIVAEVPPPKPAIIKKPAAQSTATAQTPTASESQAQVTRIKEPYSFQPYTNEVLNASTRASLVNIFCMVNNGQSVSGSGTIIDPRGVVLTNAHVGQFVMLSEVSSDISCFGRSGAPASAKWKLRTLFVPSTWVHENAKKLRTPQPTGTGEHDYALLLLEPLEGSPFAPPFPFMPYDTREAVSFEGDPVMLASYPAGFVGGYTIQSALYPATTISTIKKLYTFRDNSIDVLSLGGVILAQGGSSGGATVNQWGRLVGVIVTTSEGATTAERDLRAVSLAHINRSVREHTGSDLEALLADDIRARAQQFRNTELAPLAQELVNEIPQQ